MLTLNDNPTSTSYASHFIGYNASRAALDMFTVQPSEALRDTGIKGNAVSPKFVKTDLTGYGVMTPAEGARRPVKYALEGDESGAFIEPDGRPPR
ncbi:hypothetical protein [Kosakonia oryzendophytica]|uniref:hypothetical protein n=1 Tax=Kosakonia TaxID=1330547 RepID=UPI00077776C5|nr:hypothetical protein [Kosakonia oryzendophytica]WBT59149.1 hypothetical protein O9K67_04960 [Kosakonia oryzendophytica]